MRSTWTDALRWGTLPRIFSLDADDDQAVHTFERTP